MIININDKEFEINTKLGTTFKIEERFKKPYLKILSDIENLTAKEQLGLITCGLNKDDEVEFKNCINEFGLGKLSEILEEFVDALQYPGLNSEEIEQKKLEKINKQKRMREIGLIN